MASICRRSPNIAWKLTASAVPLSGFPFLGAAEGCPGLAVLLWRRTGVGRERFLPVLKDAIFPNSERADSSRASGRPQHDSSKPKDAMATNTVRLHRVLRATPEHVYRAFLDADAMAKWLPPRGFTGKIHHWDARIGGTHKMSFTNFTTGQRHSFGGEYLELLPNERIRYTDKFDDPNLPGTLQVTVILKKLSIGTELNIVQEGVPDVIPPEACYLGWQESLNQLAQLVEAEVS
jgi:uncharacterized protein YndB with AHSA1/START domain